MATQTISIIPKKITGGREDMVLLPRSEFEKIQERLQIMPSLRGYEAINHSNKHYKVPIFQLNEKASVRLDKRVKKALREFKAGKAKQIRSLADLM